MIHHPFVKKLVANPLGTQENEAIILRPGERNIKSVLTEAG
jgi:hypothetical protein